MDKATIFNIQKFSVHDGPGIRTIIFLKGCPLRCIWCANPESNHSFPEIMRYPGKCIGCGKCADVCGTGALVEREGCLVSNPHNCINCGKCVEHCHAQAIKMAGKEMTVEEVIKEVDKDMVFYKKSGGGVTFSGGEPLLFPDFVTAVARHYKEQGISTAMETCGYVDWANFEKALPFINHVLFDVKLIDDEKHWKYTGVSNAQILANLKRAAGIAHTVVRIPIIPSVNNAKEDIHEFGCFLKQLDHNVDTVHILPYHNMGSNKYKALGKTYKLEKLQAPSDGEMNEIKGILEAYVGTVVIGG